jgi:hypothetical protein
MNPRRKRIAWLVAAVVLVAAVAGGVVLTRDDSGSDTEPAPAETGAGVLPLLGTRGDVPDRPALAVKIENTGGGRPQTGLADADVVFEEVVEGGLTRLLAVYHSQDPDTVGPVRSARSTDIPLLAELGRPLFAWSGANPTFAAAVRAADIVDVGAAAAPDAYRRDDDRRAPYNLYASPEGLRAAGDEGDPDAGVPPALFTHRDEGASLDGPGTEPVDGYTTEAGATGLTTTIRWNWDAPSGTWQRTQDGTPHVVDDDTRVSAANVIVRFTPYRDSGVRDSVGAVVPEAVTTGDGDAWLLSEGRLQRARWQKATDDAPTTYTAADGSPLRLTPGPTWVEVLPPGTGDVLPAAG